VTRFLHVLSGLDAVVQSDVTGIYFALVPGSPAGGWQGETIEDALENRDDARMAVLEVLREDDPERLQRLCRRVTTAAPDVEASVPTASSAVGMIPRSGELAAGR
jgi:predicted RNase H-like HicB family nuclease